MATIFKKVRLVLDRDGDTLYVRLNGAKFHSRRVSVNDIEVIFEHDSDSNIIGATILGISILGDKWKAHPDRHSLPLDLVEAIDNYETIMKTNL